VPGERTPLLPDLRLVLYNIANILAIQEAIAKKKIPDIILAGKPSGVENPLEVTMVAAAFPMTEKNSDFCEYTSTRVDSDVLKLVKAAAALDGKRIQDWISDAVNDVAAKRLKIPPVKRKPIKEGR
jgi:hypothetical protein